MAGVKGMGSPEDVQTAQAEPVFTAPAAPAPAMSQSPQRKPLDQIFGQAPARKPLDQIFKAQPQSEYSSDPGSFEQRFGVSGEDMMINPVYAIGKAAFNGFGELPSRAKAALQVTNKELKQSLQQSFGVDNVRGSGDSIDYRGKDGKWRTWDNGITVEDFTVDMIRPVIEEAPATAATALAAVPAVASTVGTGGAAAPLSGLGLIAARSAGAVAGQGLADFLQSLTGVERDEDRSAALEYGLSAVLAPASGAVGDWVTKKIAARAIAKKTANLMTPENLFKEEIQGTKEALQVVQQYGGLENIPGTGTPITLSQLNPSNPDALKITKEASSMTGFQQAQELVSQNFDRAAKTFLNILGMSDNPSTAKTFQKAVETMTEKEGKIIGEVRDLLVDQAGPAELPIPKLKAGVENFAKEIGFNLNGENNLKGLVNNLFENGYKKSDATRLVIQVNKMLEMVNEKEGRATAQELLDAYGKMNTFYRQIVRGGSEITPLLQQKVGEFRKLFAQELVDKASVIADSATQSKYTKSLARYKELVESGDEFAKLLDKNSFSSYALSKSVFSGGANAVDTANAAKILLKERPELLAEVGGSFLQDLAAQNTNAGIVNWPSVFKELDSPKYKAVMPIIFGDNWAKAFSSFKRVAETIEKGSVNFKNPVDQASIMKDMAASVKNYVYLLKSGLGLFKETASGKAFAQAVSEVGIDEFIKTAPKDAKPILTEALDQFLQGTKVSAYPMATYVGRTGKRVSKERADDKNK